ncbi:tetratricopeptide repeat protein [Kitasatospora sp. NPDC057692]|uniref:tetratricopeptide repeat protein n=1 Tax=Kitasatospora sp. NPDC057692 TaxID=3346215 RepID=UPI00368AC947
MAVQNEISDSVFFHAVVQGEVVHLRLPPAVAPALSGLPPASPAFAGREAELSAVLADLMPADAGTRPGTVLVTAVAGLAGVGKTELAVQAAARAAREDGWFPGGVLFVDLFGYDPARRVAPEQALDGLLRALGIPGEHIPPDVQDRSRLLRSALAALAQAGRRVLLVLDNAATVEQVRPLLPGDGATTALVTSRHTLALDARLHGLRALSAEAAVDVLDHALRQARPADSRVVDAPEDALALARLCAGLPLALRITAALLADTPTRPVASLVHTLTAAHTRLDRLRREERAVRAAFDLSYRALDEPHARLFRLLPLNPGPDLSTGSAAHLAGDGDPYATEELLQDLARAHLVEPGQSWGRWRLHDLVRLYADDRGLAEAEADARDEARARLHHHYVTTTQAADTHLSPLADRSPRFADRSEALAWLDAEHANLLALSDPGTTVDLAFALAWYLGHRRRLDDLITIDSAALAVLRPISTRRVETARLMTNLATAFCEVRRFEEAAAMAAEALAISRELGDTQGESGGENALGRALVDLGRLEEAVEAHRRSAVLNGRIGDRHGEAVSFVNIGGTLHKLGRFAEAADFQGRSAAVFREMGDPQGEAASLTNLGLSLCRLGRFDEAIDVAARAVATMRAAGDRHGEARALLNIGVALGEVGRFEEAAEAETRAAAVFREFGDVHREAQVLAGLSATLRSLGRLGEAVGAAEQAVAAYREAADAASEAGTLMVLADTLRVLRRFEEAAEACARAGAVYGALGDRRGEAHALTGLGLALGDAQRSAEAIDVTTRALAAHRADGDRRGEARALAALAVAMRAMGRFEEAVAACRESLPILGELGDGRNEAGTSMVLGVVLAEAGRLPEAIEAGSRAAELFRVHGDRHAEGLALSNVARMWQDAERPDEAVAALAGAAAVLAETGDRAAEGVACDDLGRALVEVGRFGEAVGAFTRAVELFGALGDHKAAAHALAGLGAARRRGGE